MTLSIGYGLITVQRTQQDESSWEEVYADALHLAQFAEQAGFDSAWVSEHHLGEDGYLSSVLPFLSALAATTDRMILGTNIAIAPLYHPLRIAEDVASLAVIARRQVILGLGLGYRDAEYEAFGTTSGERVARLTQVVQVCRGAWAGERLRVRGPGMTVVDQVIRPQPSISPQLWLGGTADRAIGRVGRLSDGYVASTASVEELQRRLVQAQRAGAEVGRSGPLGLVTNHLVSVTADGGIDPDVASGIGHMMRTYASWMTAGDPSMPALASRLTQSPDQLAIHGSAADVAARLSPYVVAFAGERDHHLMVRLHYPGMPRRAAERHIERFAGEVAPRLRAIARSLERPDA